MNRKTISSERLPARNKTESLSPVSTSRSGKRLIGTADRINELALDLEVEIVRFRHGSRSIDFNIDVAEETVWATAQQIADLFGKHITTINEHIRSLQDEGELDEAAVRKFYLTRQERSSEAEREIDHYDLDVILAVGHRVKSPQATAFRKWAYGVLKDFLTKGYALNERRLRSDANAANDLAARLRAIRSEEKHLFAKVREFFKEASSDYDGSTKACQAFFAMLQDKFHVAASGMTACQLVLSRANHHSPNMGLTTFVGEAPTVDEAKIGKNYLSEQELRILHIVSEQFLLHVQSKAIRNIAMTMSELAKKFDELLRVNDYEVFTGYGRNFQKPRAQKHALAEYARFMVRQRKIAG